MNQIFSVLERTVMHKVAKFHYINISYYDKNIAGQNTNATFNVETVTLFETKLFCYKVGQNHP